MCILLSNTTANNGFESLRRMGQPNHELNLADAADKDDLSTGANLGSMLNDVQDWSKLRISHVRKCRKGRHRFFIVGHHSQCEYKVVFILVSKKDEDDKSADKKYQDMIWKAFNDDSGIRVVEPRKKDNEETEQKNDDIAALDAEEADAD